MTVGMPTRTCPDVFAAGLPILAYEHVSDPAEAHRLVAQARHRAPIAIGTHGPEILSDQLVRSVLRDPRFRVPNGMFLAGQGITSGPIWDRVTSSLISLDGDAHQRLRPSTGAETILGPRGSVRVVVDQDRQADSTGQGRAQRLVAPGEMR